MNVAEFLLKHNAVVTGFTRERSPSGMYEGIRVMTRNKIDFGESAAAFEHIKVHGKWSSLGADFCLFGGKPGSMLWMQSPILTEVTADFVEGNMTVTFVCLDLITFIPTDDGISKRKTPRYKAGETLVLRDGMYQQGGAGQAAQETQLVLR